MTALGHSAVWDYSPRQTAAFLAIGNRRRERELRERLAINALAASQDKKAIQKALKEP